MALESRSITTPTTLPIKHKSLQTLDYTCFGGSNPKLLLASLLLTQKWQTCWFQLWHFDLPFKAKLFFWKLLNLGIYTQTTTRMVGHSDGFCKLCPREDEHPNHLFLCCPFMQCCWQLLTNRLSDHYARNTLTLAPLLINLLDACLPQLALKLVCLAVFYKVTRELWN